jgi:hypothetical protein
MPKTLFTSKRFVFYPDAELAWELIEMGKDIDALYPDSYKTENLLPDYAKSLTPLLLEDEKFAMLEGKYFDYAVTSFGRTFNVKTQKPVLVYFGMKDIQLVLRGDKINLSEIFEENGWEYSIEEISKIYQQYNWPVKISRNNLKQKNERDKPQ